MCVRVNVKELWLLIHVKKIKTYSPLYLMKYTFKHVIRNNSKLIFIFISVCVCACFTFFSHTSIAIIGVILKGIDFIL